MKNKEIVGTNLPQEQIEENFVTAKKDWLKSLNGLSLAEYEDKIQNDALEKINDNQPKTVFENIKPSYKLLVLDMFSYGESRIEGDFHSADEALRHAKKIVLKSFDTRGREGYEEWLSFGESVSIIELDGASPVEFSAQDYVKKICGISY